MERPPGRKPGRAGNRAAGCRDPGGPRKTKEIMMEGNTLQQRDEEMEIDLCKAAGAEIACSRGVAEDLKWLPLERYIGISGVEEAECFPLSPNRYAASRIWISGADLLEDGRDRRNDIGVGGGNAYAGCLLLHSILTPELFQKSIQLGHDKKAKDPKCCKAAQQNELFHVCPSLFPQGRI